MVKQMLSLALLVLLPASSFAQTTNYGPTLTQAALQIQGAISAGCNETESCVQFVTDVVPRCQRLQGDAGCWCGNHNPLHFCAICMSNPTSNLTSPDQTAAALEGHQNYHIACNAYEQALNASASATGTASATGASAASTSAPAEEGGKKAPIGAIVGGAVGGGIAVAIGVLVLVLWLRSRKRHTVAPSSVSLFSAAGASSYARPYSGYGNPQAGFGHHDNQMGGQRESAFAPGYAPASVPYPTDGLHTPGLNSVSDGSYKKHPEPMAPGPY